MITPPVTKPPLRLLGVSTSNGRRRVLVDFGDEGAAPRWYGVGDSVEGWTVDAISGKDVRLASGTERFTVALYPPRPAEPQSPDGKEPR